MSKWVWLDPFGYLKHKLWAKERQGVKLSIWLLITKNQESPWFPCMHVACHIMLESSWQGLQIFFGPQFNQRFACKFMGLQSRANPNFGNFATPETKWHLGVGPMARHKEYYKGESGGFPQVRAVVSLLNLCLPVARPCTKNALTMH
jgi:hypothetical protein